MRHKLWGQVKQLMKRTEQYRFDLLISFFDRYVKIHRDHTYPDPSKDFGNAIRGKD